MRGAENFQEFLKIWLDKLTNKLNDYSIPVASNTTNKLLSKTNLAKLDSGASQHYIILSHKHLLSEITKTYNGSEIQLPNNKKLQVLHKEQINIHKLLPMNAKQAYILPNLTNKSLLSVGQLCNNNCTVEFGKYFCDIKHKNQLILKGTRNFNDGLYGIELEQAHKENNASSQT